jgi:hypothetical protein
VQVKTRLIERLMTAPNTQWLAIINEAGKVRHHDERRVV